MSSGLCMYKIRPVITHDEMNMQSTHNMYKVRPLNGCIDKTPLSTMGDIPSMESRQEEVLKKLAQLKINMANLREEINAKKFETAKKTNQAIRIRGSVKTKNACQPCSELKGLHDIVVCASPQYPPYSLLGLVKAWGPDCPLILRSYTHSSLSSAPEVAKLFTTAPIDGKPCLIITVIWKDVGRHTELTVSPLKHVTIRGETNILRFLSRVGPHHLSYEDSDLVQITRVDELLDICETLVSTGSNTEKQSVIQSLGASLGKASWLCGRDQLSIADVAVWSAFKQVLDVKEIPQRMSTWFEHCNSILGNC